MLLSTVYNDKPQVALVQHPQTYSSFITWLCLFSPCGPFSDWMNWKGWGFELNNTSYSHNPMPHLQKASHPHAAGCKFCFSYAERALCVAAPEKKEPVRTRPDLCYVRIFSIIYANSPDSFATLDLENRLDWCIWFTHLISSPCCSIINVMSSKIYQIFCCCLASTLRKQDLSGFYLPRGMAR